MKEILYSLFLFIFIPCLIGCNRGTQRTSLDKWETIKDSALGIQMEVPVAREQYTPIVENKIPLLFQLHPVNPGSLSDTPYLIRFMASSLKKEEYDLYLKNKIGDSQIIHFNDMCFNAELKEYQLNSSYTNYRKDIKKPNGDVFLCSIIYFHNRADNKQYKELDITAIKRILNSIKFIDDNFTLNPAKGVK